MRTLATIPAFVGLLLTGILQPASVQATEPDSKALRKKVVERGIAYLASKGQDANGGYSAAYGIGPTAIITTALIRHGRPVSDPQVARSLRFLEKSVQKDGGIHQNGTVYRNYETCLAIMCFKAANKNGKYDKIIRRADRFIKGLQWDEDEGQKPSDLAYGGGGYGRNKRPDLSNTSFLIEALKAAGNDADSDAMKRALQFVSRCQNHESAHNTTPFSSKVNDGGFFYTPASGGSSQAGKTANGGLRSYGAMTYAGLKSMLYAGVNKKDGRVKAAISWIQKHYDVKSNPGLGDAGLFYYYNLFAKALHALDEDTIVDQQGKKHSWKDELIRELASRQNSNGSWTNKNEKWLEGDANLATGFALMALSYCK